MLIKVLKEKTDYSLPKEGDITGAVAEIGGWTTDFNARNYFICILRKYNYNLHYIVPFGEGVLVYNKAPTFKQIHNDFLLLKKVNFHYVQRIRWTKYEGDTLNVDNYKLLRRVRKNNRSNREYDIYIRYYLPYKSKYDTTTYKSCIAFDKKPTADEIKQAIMLVNSCPACLKGELR